MHEQMKTVLVVDDDPDARDYLSTVLEDNGFAVLTAQDGSEALFRVEQEAPSLISLDITMPGKSGVAVYRKLKEDEQFKNIPVVIITGISDDFKTFISNRRHIPPPDGYINKPVDPDEFLRMVKKLIV